MRSAREKKCAGKNNQLRPSLSNSFRFPLFNVPTSQRRGATTWPDQVQERHRRRHASQGSYQLHRLAREGPRGEAELSELGGGWSIVYPSPCDVNMSLFVCAMNASTYIEGGQSPPPPKKYIEGSRRQDKCLFCTYKYIYISILDRKRGFQRT